MKESLLVICSLGIHYQFFLAFDVFMKRRRPIWIMFSSSYINVSIGICAILARPARYVMHTGYLDDLVHENHDVRIAILRLLFAPLFVMFNSVVTRRNNHLILMPRYDCISSIGRRRRCFDRCGHRFTHNVVCFAIIWSKCKFANKFFQFLYNKNFGIKTKR